jgi:phage internal scaffolding protein
MTKKEIQRTDDVQAKLWAQKRNVVDEYTRPEHAGLIFTDPSRTDKSQASENDINSIIRKYKKTGVLPNVNKEALFADVSNAPDYQSALNTVITAQNQFNALNAETRKKFANDPSLFMEFVHNAENAPELIKMGLANLIPKTDTQQIVEAINASKESQKELGEAKPAK